MTNRRRKRLKSSKIPVIKKDLESGVVAEANNDGTIYVDKDVKSGSPLEKEAIAHEMVHMDQMKRGDLNYDDNNVYWKGKKYSRKQMNEGSANLPWEKEAYDKTDHIDGSNNKAGSTANNNNKEMKKSSPNKIIYSGARASTRLGSNTINQRAGMLNDQLRIEADKNAMIGEGVGKISKQLYDDDFADSKDGMHDKGDTGDTETTNENNTEITNSATDMNKKNKNKSAFKMKATPITMKASRSAMPSAIKMKSSPLHVETTSTREFKGNVDDEYGTIKESKITKRGEKKESVKNFANSCYNADGSKKAEGTVVNGILCSWKKDEDFDPNTEYDNQVKYESSFTPDEKTTTSQEPGTPGTPDKYNMGYYESMDAKYGAGVRNRDRKKLGRILDREGRRYDRGKGSINPETGEKFENKEDYLSYVAKSRGSEFNIPVGKTRKGTTGTEPGEKVTTKSNAEANPDADTYVINDDGSNTKVKKSNSGADMNKKNKNKSAFKMKGFSGFNK